MVSNATKQNFIQAISDILPDTDARNKIINVFDDVTKNCTDLPCNFGDIMYVMQGQHSSKLTISKAKVVKISLNINNDPIIYGVVENEDFRQIAWNKDSIGVYVFFNKRDAENARNNIIAKRKAQKQ